MIQEKKFSIIFLLLTILCQAVAAVLGKYAAISLDEELPIVVQIIVNPYYLLGLTFLGFQTIFWILTLCSFDLSLAYPAMSVNYLLVVCFSVIVFQEIITVNNILGLLLIFSGIVILFSKKQIITNNHD